MFEKKRPRTWVKITREGRQALSEELAVLRELIAAADRPPTDEALRSSGGP